ncbi:MAG: hypothetical protein IT162_02555 [Bryobacterales bacterium]|nr:hypothetical protein [Bryobacterales bacterium]
MKTFLTACGFLALATWPAAALEKEFVDRILQSAQSIERDATQVDQSLKKKPADATEVRQKIEAMSADVTRLQELVKQFESTGTALSERDQADWRLVKDKVQLLEIFHSRKQTLASEDVNKNRSLLRAHAKGVAFRAQKLQQTAQKLRRG